MDGATGEPVEVVRKSARSWELDTELVALARELAEEGLGVAISVLEMLAIGRKPTEKQLDVLRDRLRKKKAAGSPDVTRSLPRAKPLIVKPPPFGDVPPPPPPPAPSRPRLKVYPELFKANAIGHA